MIFLEELETLLIDRKKNPKSDSYTSKLFQENKDRLLKKITEEAGEIIIASKNSNKKEIIHEASDLLFHLIVLLVNEDIKLNEIIEELKSRVKK